MMTMTLSKMLYGFRMYPNKPKASNMKPISRTNMLVKTMLLISNTSVSSSGWWVEGRRGGGEGVWRREGRWEVSCLMRTHRIEASPASRRPQQGASRGCSQARSVSRPSSTSALLRLQQLPATRQEPSQPRLPPSGQPGFCLHEIQVFFCAHKTHSGAMVFILERKHALVKTH